LRPEEKKSSNFLCPPRFKHTLTIVIHPKTPGYPGALNPNRAISNGNFRAASVVVQGIRNPLPSTPPASACWAEQRCAPHPPRAPAWCAEPRHGPQTVPDEPGQKETGRSGAKNEAKPQARAEHKSAPRPASACSLLPASACAPVPLPAAYRLHSRSPCPPPSCSFVSTPAEADQGERLCFGRRSAAQPRRS
jgi:hypothetical protein